MSYYFGFVPSAQLQAMIDDLNDLVDSNPSEYALYPKRDAVVHQLADELIDNMLVSLLDFIPDPQRKAKMQNIINTVESASTKLLQVLLGKDKNKQVLPTYQFYKIDSTFVGADGQKRIGFKLDDAKATKIINGFDAVTPTDVDIDRFRVGLEIMNHAVLQHFIVKFADTLPLGFVKRKSVPVAKAAVEKGLDTAVNKLFPQLADDAMNRLKNFYAPFIVEVE